MDGDALRVLCAPDSFKGSLTAAEAAEAMRRGVLDAAPDSSVEACPIADGGEGTVEAMIAAVAAERVVTRVTGPRGEAVEAAWALLPGHTEGPAGPTAVIAMAAASGLTLLDASARDPERTTTYGTGELLAAAIDRGATSMLVGIGGSATCDAGCGLAQALGATFHDNRGRRLDAPLAGEDLSRIASVDLSALRERCEGVRVRVACDVTNPLTGPDGAQKGADAAAVRRLDAGLRHVARVWRDQLGIDGETLAGAGAAGGLGAGLAVMVGASLERGIDLVLGAVGFGARVAGCDVCLTGEGKLDGQSLSGKAVLGVAGAAASHGVPTWALVGRAANDADRTLEAGLAGYREIAPGMAEDRAMRDAGPLLRRATAELVRELRGGPGGC